MRPIKNVKSTSEVHQMPTKRTLSVSPLVRMAFCIIGFGILSSCAEPKPQPFDTTKWLVGNASVRASMVQDINQRRLLEGKTKAEVVQLLGKPDYELNEWVWSYKVITIPRCRFIWPCGMELGFNPKTGKATGGVAISD